MGKKMPHGKRGGKHNMEKNRMMYIDNIRLLVIIFVVVQHLAVTYSGFGDWYYMEPGQIGTIQTILFGIYQAFTQGYTMGLLFLIAGYFIPAAYDKKGFGKFVKDRLIRLGAPTIIYMLIIHPFVAIVVLGMRPTGGGMLSTYIEYIIRLQFIGGSGPLWFTFALLIFTVIYAITRKIIAAKASASEKDFPASLKILAIILIISVCSFLVRLVQPIGTSVINMQLPYFSQYVVLFIIGIKCKRNNWIEKLDYTKTGKPWLIWGLSLGFVLFAVMMISGGALEGDLSLFDGGMTWQSAAYALWESFIAVSMSIGLIALFKEKLNKQNSLIKIMSANAFSVYVFHSLIIVAITLLLAPIALIPILKFAITIMLCVPICFVCVNYTIQKIPFLRKLFA